jgi:hypothetical protein
VRAVNLIPAEQRERRTGYANRSNGVAYIVLGVFAVLSLMALLYGVAKHEVSSKESEAAHYEAEAQRVQAQATSLAPYKSFIAMREGRERAVRELVDTRFDWAHAVAEFGRVLPPGTSIGSLEGCVSVPSTTGGGGEAGCSGGGGGGGGSSSKSSGGAVTSATPQGSVPRFTMSGCAVSQSTVARMLSDLRLIDGVAGAELTSATKSGAGGGGGGGAGGSTTCQGGEVSFGAKVIFQPLPAPPSGSSSSSKAVPAASSSGSAASRKGAPE